MTGSDFILLLINMDYLRVTDEALKKGAEILKSGGLVAFPTETVYGLGADAFNPKAIARIFEVKNRPFFDPLIIHIANIDALEKTADLSRLSKKTHDNLFKLAEKLWPGPLSIILPKNDKIPGIATSGLPTAAIRLPDNEAARKLIALSSGAVAAPSANPFGALSPTRAEHVKTGLGEKVDLILDGGPCKIGVESTVLDITDDCIKILRPGGTPREAIEKLIDAVEGYDNNEQRDSGEQGLASPGLLKSHYAPETPLTVLSREEIIKLPINEDQKTAFLFYDGNTRDRWLSKQFGAQEPPDSFIIKVLSQTGDLLEAASRLFETLHEIDNCNITQIFAQLAPRNGLGEAINDRLQRGAKKDVE